MRARGLDRFSFVLLAFLLGLPGAARVSAQPAEEEAAERVVRITVDAPAAADLVRIRETIRIREGDPYSEDAVRRDIAALYQLGEFADVRVETRRVEEGLELIYHLELRPRIGAITFEIEGDIEISESDLRDELLLRAGDLASPFRLKRDERALRERLRREGYLSAEVTQQTRETNGDVEIAYDIKPGPQTELKGVRFEGNEPVSEGELKAVMLSIDEAFLFGEDRFDPDLVESDMIAVREIFRRKGWLDATASHEVVYTPDREEAALVVRIEKGPRYRIEHIHFRGMERFSADRLDTEMQLEKGDAFSVEQLEEDLAALRDLYGAEGYIGAALDVRRTISETEPAVGLVVNIDEGPRYRVRKVRIAGNYRTKDHVIRRDIALIPGEVATTVAADETRRELRATGLFAAEPGQAEPVQVDFLETEEPGEVDVRVEVSEGPMGDFSLGAGYNTSYGLVGNVRVTLYNFDALDFPKSWEDFRQGGAWLGGGQRLTLSLSPGADYQDYELSWFNPSLYDGPWFAGFSLYWHEFAWEDYYDDQRIGASVTVGREVYEDLEVSLTPQVERIDISDVDSGAPGDAAAARGTDLKNSITLAAVYDKRDDPFLTTDGYLLSGSVEMAGVILGGDVDYFKETIEARNWWTVWEQEDWGEHVISIGGEAAMVQTGDSGSVPFYERLFMGGLGTIRGFEYLRAGPIDPASRLQTGGTYRLLANAEYEAPLYKNILRGVLFVDAGMLERSLGDFDGDSPRVTTGIGLRVRLPRGGSAQIPINIYLAVPVVDESTDDAQLFNVSIGTGFTF